MIKVAGSELDILYTGNLLERKHEDDGALVKVQNWDGKEPPVISMADFTKRTGLFTERKAVIQEKNAAANRRAEQSAQRTLDEETWTVNNDVAENAELVEEILNALPAESLKSRLDWIKVLHAVRGNITDIHPTDYWRKLFNKKFKAVHTELADENGLVNGEAWDVWRKENDREFKKKRDHHYHNGVLWKHLYKHNREAWVYCKNKTTAQVPDGLVMEQLRYYDGQKTYWEKYAFLVKEGKAPLIYIKDFTKNKWFGSGPFTKQELRGSDWAGVKSFRKELKTDKNGNPILSENGQPQYEDKYLGDFVTEWLKDQRKRNYIYQDFLPEGCEHIGDDDATAGLESSTTKNHYQGMKIDQKIGQEELTAAVEKEMARGEEEDGDPYSFIEPILELIFFLCGKDMKVFDYVCKFISLLLLYPAIRPEVFIIFQSTPGVGKNMFWDWLGKKLIGTEYYLCSAKPDMWFDKHSISKENKILMVLNEMALSQMKKYDSELKEIVTDPTLSLNPKNEKMRTCRNVGSYVGFTNMQFAVANENGQRRKVFIQCANDHTLITGYFNAVVSRQNDLRAQAMFVKYMREVVAVDPYYEFQPNMPKTKYHKALSDMCSRLEMKFMKDLCYRYNQGDADALQLIGTEDAPTKLKTIEGGLLYKSYTKWVTDSREGGGEEKLKSKSNMKFTFEKHVINLSQTTIKDGSRGKKLEDPLNISKYIIKTRKKDVGQVYQIDLERFKRYYAQDRAKERGECVEEVYDEINNAGRSDVGKPIDWL